VPKDGSDAPKDSEAPKDPDTAKDPEPAKDPDADQDTQGRAENKDADSTKEPEADANSDPSNDGDNNGNPPSDGTDDGQPLHEGDNNSEGDGVVAKQPETNMEDPSATWKGDGEGADHLPGLDGMKPDEVKAMVDSSGLPEDTKAMLQDIIDGKTPLTTNKEKGNFGELMQDIYYKDQGYEAIHQNPATGLDSKGHQGIDGVYYKEGGHPPYIIAEAKFTSDGSAPSMGDTKRSGPQMGVRWIKGRLGAEQLGLSPEHLTRLQAAMEADTGQVGARLFHVDGSGNVAESKLNLGGNKS
jgi:hypothetical protein